ncbi:hypothetical protein [Pollutibacter soli]|uniref:hypothetical protein n=1 Tax=Pollutibacter soli TaxID=3034157 RepID=UPI0030136562
MPDAFTGLFIKILKSTTASEFPYKSFLIDSKKIVASKAGDSIILNFTVEIQTDDENASLQETPLEIDKIDEKCKDEKNPYAFLKFEHGTNDIKIEGFRMNLGWRRFAGTSFAKVNLTFEGPGGKVNASGFPDSSQ